MPCAANQTIAASARQQAPSSQSATRPGAATGLLAMHVLVGQCLGLGKALVQRARQRIAGEQGRGFDVVADEVRTLAQRTQESTETIRQTISQFQHGTNQVLFLKMD